uniref:Fibronectin type III-like domain-containing protein n=1 Tax=Globisporangium ultimum (strain ATCC 200006 / CBS 805.95 / DAOM BR144) TaxID=431595 RepID=K3X6N1_GLOUD
MAPSRVLRRVLPALLGLLAALPLCTAIPRACEAPHSALPFCNTSLATPARVEDLLHRLSLREKVLLLTARASPRGNVSVIGLPEYNWGANCVHGVQSTCGTNCATNFPNPVNIGAIFDTDVVKKMAQVIGWELRALWLEGARENYAAGPHLGLDCWSPNININRDPRWGRNMETPSEDPLVNALYGVAYTRGLQEGPDLRFLQAVVTLKHWVAYSYEHYAGVDRMAFDAIVSKYDFADTYFPAFRASVVDGNAKGIMCSYNSLNGMPMCANDATTHLLRDTLGFDGYITSDSGALRGIFDHRHYTKTLCDAGLLAIQSGTDINSGEVYQECIEKLVAEKRLEGKYIDDAIRHSLKLRFELGLFDPIDDQPYWHVAPSEVRSQKSQKLSLDMTRKSLVLLQNHGETLPLQKGKKVAVIGPHAGAREGMMGNYYGQICHGDYKELNCVQTPFEALTKKNGAPNTKWARGCGINDTSTSEFSSAVAITKEADAVVLFLGIDTSIEREAYDRENIELPAIQMQLLKTIRRVGKPTVVVLFNGGVIGTEELILHTDSLVEAFYPGFYGAEALADILFGDHNPGGKLPATMYRSNYIDSVQMKSMSMTEYPGRSYKYYKEVPVFPFGYGLSYTKFSIASSNNGPEDTISSTQVVSRDLNATFQLIVSNDGNRSGDEVVFGFFRPLSIDATGPVTLLNQQLFTYKRVSLAPAEVTQLEFRVTEATLALYDDAGNLTLFPGFYEVFFTNGVHERVAFLVHLQGEKRIIRPFELKSAPIPADSEPTVPAASSTVPTTFSQAASVLLDELTAIE